MVNIEKTLYGNPFSIKKGNGIFAFRPNGGTGKTYVFSILKQLDKSRLKEKVTAVTYSSDYELLKSNLNVALDDENKYDLIYLDRADLYMTEEIYKKLLKLSKHATVIMNMNYLPDYADDTTGVASIYYGNKGVHVF
jgi:hypothetical protein